MLQELLALIDKSASGVDAPFALFCAGAFEAAVKTDDAIAAATLFDGVQNMGFHFPTNAFAVRYICLCLSRITACGVNLAVKNAGDYAPLAAYLKARASDIRVDMARAYMAAALSAQPTDSELYRFYVLLDRLAKDPDKETDDVLYNLEAQKKAFLASIETPEFEQIGVWLRTTVDSPIKAQLLTAIVKCYLPEKYDAFIARWRQDLPGELDLEGFDILARWYQEDLSLSKNITDELSKRLQVRSNQGTYKRLTQTGTAKYRNATCHYWDQPYAQYIADWLTSDGPTGLGLAADNTSIVVHFDDGPPLGHGCVSRGTRIRVWSAADGTTEIPVERVTENTRVFTGGGNFARTSDERVVNHHIKRLYGVNNIAPFMSAEHAIRVVDADGVGHWKSPDPKAANAINPHHHVTRLQIGDRFVCYDDGAEPVLQTIQKITWQEAPPDAFFTGYDLHFREGYPRYFANGILCLLNYPEITAASLRRNLQALPDEAAQAFFKSVEENEAVFRALFGDDAIDALASHANHE